MITEDYVSFETAKLLNEKGFWNRKIERRYILNDVSVYRWICGNSYKEFKSGELVTYRDQEFLYHEIIENSIDAPTLQMAMKWVRETYNIHIVPYFDKLQNSDDLPYSFTLYLVSEHCATIEKTACFDIDENYYWKYPEQACEAAIKYCLENLI